MDEQELPFMDVTSFGDKSRRTIRGGRTITDPQEIARINATRVEQMALWHQAAEEEAREKGYASLDEMLSFESGWS